MRNDTSVISGAHSIKPLTLLVFVKNKIRTILLTCEARTRKVLFGGLPHDSSGWQTVQFTAGQLRETVGVSVEMYRHWKRVLPPFLDRQGYVPTFTIGDLVAARVLRCLTETFGVRAGHLSRLSVDIVRLCNETPWAKLASGDLVIDPEGETCQLARNGGPSVRAKPIILCPMAHLMAELGGALQKRLPVSNQRELQFPPIECREATRGARRSS
ncbi:hypothetical protein [Bradyrhizobium sp. SZCCHNR2035]|uniref:hypothetical protein n=1 Tax=Bradyrhizobium sp. SZCCHNR2035 TaxID=3057386 RepID=UPI002916C647|nr:hypothetical protein [Bradyrhizobium sp. SZCCHNR2035]